MTRPSWQEGGAAQVPSPEQKQPQALQRGWAQSLLAPGLGGAALENLTWVSVKLSRACITDCSGLEA